MNFNGKVVLVTGASAGIGKAACILFAKNGAKVAINDIVESDTLIEVNKYSEGIFLKGDVSDPADAKSVVQRTIAQFGRLDILVNNAGIVVPGRIDNTEEDDWDRTMRINLKGIYLMSREAVSQMKEQGAGVIVNTSSSVALKGVKDRAAYSASKGGVLSLTRAMAADYMDWGIRVNCICPGTTMTPSLEKRLAAFEDPEKARQEFIARQPMKILGKPEEIAYAIMFASCDEAKFMNGSALSIDGGMTCC